LRCLRNPSRRERDSSSSAKAEDLVRRGLSIPRSRRWNTGSPGSRPGDDRVGDVVHACAIADIDRTPKPTFYEIKRNHDIDCASAFCAPIEGGRAFSQACQVKGIASAVALRATADKSLHPSYGLGCPEARISLLPRKQMRVQLSVMDQLKSPLMALQSTSQGL